MNLRLAHIGLPKTATTFLQRHYFPQVTTNFYTTDKIDTWPKDFDFVRSLNSEWTKHLYFKDSNVNESQQHLDEYCLKNFFAWKQKIILNSHLKDLDPFIVSAEGLSAFSLPVTEKILILLRYMNIKQIFLTIRRQDTYASSLWRQLLLREDRFRKYHSFDSLFLSKPAFFNLNWLYLYKLLCRYFTPNSILILPYELFLQDKYSFFDRINSFIGSNTSFSSINTPSIPSAVVNTSLNSNYYYGLRYGSIFPLSHSSTLRWGIKKIVLNLRVPRRIFLNKYSMDLPEVKLAKILSSYRESNKQLSDITNLRLDNFSYF